ncbi:MAG: tRNA (adenosine(37)-N6)-dimethylallyltransferase MiaA [Bacteroidota bacterium]
MSAAPALILAGPTAVGKSSLGLSLAEAIGGEILSADSRQVYRGFDIGTAKSTASEQARIPHHLIDRLDPGEPYSAGQFFREAREVLVSLAKRGTPAIVVGGSTLYVHALVEGLADLPPVPPELVAALTEAAQTASGRAVLYDELVTADPEAAATLDPTKSQRLVRFVGVLRTTSRRPSDLWREAAVPGVAHRLVVLRRERADLYDAIDRRVGRMVAGGLEAEARQLYDAGEDARRTMQATIGYREWPPVFEGRSTRHEAITRIQRDSRRYAKRQMTWYRRYPEAVVLDADGLTPERVMEAATWPPSST